MSERKRKRRITVDEKYKRDDKRTEMRGLTELERRGERKEHKEDRFSWQLTESKKRNRERSKPDEDGGGGGREMEGKKEEIDSPVPPPVPPVRALSAACFMSS